LEQNLEECYGYTVHKTQPEMHKTNQTIQSAQLKLPVETVPVQTGRTTKFDPNNEEHEAIYQVYKLDFIPILEGSDGVVDYSQLKMKQLEKMPTLSLHVSKEEPKLMTQKLAIKVAAFKDLFRHQASAQLGNLLFDKTGQQYVPNTLSNYPNLAKDF
jgi:hypothetical protein